MTEIRTRLREFIANEIMYGENRSDLTDDTRLLGGVIDSLGLIQIVSFIEHEFDVTIADSEVTVRNFESINAIDRLIQQKATVR